MPADSYSFISEVLKLYDSNADLKFYDYVKQTYVPDSDNATIESPCSNPHVDDVHQSPMLSATNESCIECFWLLHAHLKILFDQPGYLGGYGRAFETLFRQDVRTFTVTMTLYLDQL